MKIKAFCEKHQIWYEYDSESMLKINCPSCNDEAGEYKLQLRNELESNKREMKTKKLIEKAGIPVRFSKCSFDNFIVSDRPQQDVIDRCNNYIECMVYEERPKNLFLCGNCGTGKTHLSISILKEIIQQKQIPGLYCCLNNLIQEVWSTINNKYKSKEAVISPPSNTPFLVLDEVGSHKVSNSTIDLVYEIINKRYEMCVPTVIVSNNPFSRLRYVLGEKAIDRLRDDNSEIICLEWQSWRKTS